MIHELSQRDFPKVRALYEPLRFHMCSLAALEGRNWGRVLVDHPSEPAASLMLCAEGTYLAGAPPDEGFIHALNKALVADHLFGQLRWLSFVLSSEAWLPHLLNICRPYSPKPQARRHYVCRQVTYDWRHSLPSEVEVQRIDPELIGRPGLTIPEHLDNWMRFNWGSSEAFLRDGFGFVCVRGDEIMSWCIADCISSDGAEVGIHTAPEHRRQGLAAAVVAAAVEHALAKGLPMVGWHCAKDHLCSIRTAERVGFALGRRYTSYDVEVG